MDKKMLEKASVGKRSQGPAAYSVKTTIGKLATDPTIEKNPAYSILGRRSTKDDTVGPGPGYDVRMWNHLGKDRTPGGPFGVRLGDQKPGRSPGPADFCVPIMRDQTTLRMVRPTGLRPEAKPSKPAPNAYTLPDTVDRRGAKMGQRFKEHAVHATPGPAQYDVPHADLYKAGRCRDGRTMAGRPTAKVKRDDRPGPASYCAEHGQCCVMQPSANPCRTTFGARRPDVVPPFAVPADNEYGSDCCK